MKTLKELAKMSETAEHALMMLALRPRHRKEPLRISRLKSRLKEWGSPVRHDDLIDLLKELERLNEGRIIYGRNKQAVRFNFHRPVYDIGLEALGEEKVKELKARIPAPQAKGQVLEVGHKDTRINPLSGSREVVLILPTKQTVQVRLPIDLSFEDFRKLLS